MSNEISIERLQSHRALTGSAAWAEDCLSLRRGGADAGEIKRAAKTLARLAPTVLLTAQRGNVGEIDATSAFLRELEALSSE